MNHKNQPNDKSPSDRELDALLREIEVPADLKSALRSLPSQDEAVVVESKLTKPELGKTATLQTRLSSGRIWILAGIAAGLLGVAAFLMLPRDQPPTPSMVEGGAGNSKKAEVAVEKKTETNEKASGVLFSETASAELQKQADQMIAELENKRLEWRLRELRLQEAATAPSHILAQREQTSMILAIADQAIVDMGGSLDTAAASMRSIIQQYPETMGAEIAQTFLNQSTN